MFKNPLVVGYKGEIGSFILQCLLKKMPKAKNIWCFDINDAEEDKIERIQKADIIFLCIPLEMTGDWFLQYRDHLKGKVVVEQCSLKSSINWNSPLMEGITFIHMHILFRPSSTPNKDDRRCVLLRGCPHDPMVDICSTMDAHTSIVDWDVEKHDMIMAERQALVHRVLIVLDEMMGSGSLTYINNEVRKLAIRIRSGDKKLYKRIHDNKYTGVAVTEFNSKMKIFDIDKYMYEP